MMGHRKDFGPRVVLTDDFRDDLDEWLAAEPGRTAKKLAKVIGCDPSLISLILNRKKKTETSTVVVPIVKHTGIPMPTVEADQDAVLLRQLRHLHKVDRPTYEAIVALIRARAGEDESEQ